MKVIHIESGLGNQMLSFCEYLAMRKANPEDDIYIENIIYDIPECNNITCQWNGYELENIFKIKTENIKKLFSESEWSEIMREIRESRFWSKNMNYPVYFTKAFANHGLSLVNTFGDFEEERFKSEYNERYNRHKLKNKLKKTQLYMRLKMWKMRRPLPLAQLDCKSELFIKSEEPLFAGQKLKFKYKGSGLELIENEVRKVFTFPEIKDKKNHDAFSYIKETDSVAIHARRGDMLGNNYPCYATGYFKRAVKLIRRHTSNPVFFIFCDPGSVKWAKDNADILGLDGRKDRIVFVDWNSGTESYRDMQLMAQCKHQVITNSSFGWWGAWLNTNPDKITCSPSFRINTTHTV